MLFGGLEDYEFLLVWIGIILGVKLVNNVKFSGIQIEGSFHQILFATYLFIGSTVLFKVIPLPIIKAFALPIFVGIFPKLAFIGLILFSRFFPRRVKVERWFHYFTGAIALYIASGVGYSIAGLGAIAMMIFAYVVMFALPGLGRSRVVYRRY